MKLKSVKKLKNKVSSENLLILTCVFLFCGFLSSFFSLNFCCMTDRFVILLTLIINISNELYNFTYFINLPFINYDYYKIILRKSVIISYRCLLVVAQLHSQYIRFSPK